MMEVQDSVTTSVEPGSSVQPDSSAFLPYESETSSDSSTGSASQNSNPPPEAAASLKVTSTADDSMDESSEDVFNGWRWRKKRAPDVPFVDADFRISKEDALLCALSIPEEYVPTSYEQFIDELAQDEEITLDDQPTIKTEGDDAYEEAPVRKFVRKRLCAAFAKYQKWDEREKSKLEKLGENRILVDDAFVVERDYENYVKEADVHMELDEDWKSCKMPALPSAPEGNCQAPSCRLGCICTKMSIDAAEQKHCGLLHCMLECTCLRRGLKVFGSSEPNGGVNMDIKSRLRRKVSLLNWRFLESTDHEIDRPKVTNYRELERGNMVISPRARAHRNVVKPRRFRTEIELTRQKRIKHEKSSPDASPSPATSLKSIRKKPLIKPSLGYISPNIPTMTRKKVLPIRRRKPVPNPAQSRSASSSPPLPLLSIVTLKSLSQPDDDEDDRSSVSSGKSTRLNNVKKAEVGNTSSVKSTVFSKLPAGQPLMEVPRLVQIMIEDGQILWMKNESYCFLAWSINMKLPKAVIYDDLVENDDMTCHIPWLYLPVPSYGESWVIHQVSENLDDCLYTYIPEINCIIPTKALQIHFNLAKTKGKGMNLKLIWIGEDAKKRIGSIFIFPELPHVLVCGPFPKDQIRTRDANPHAKLVNSLNVYKYVDNLYSTKRSMGVGEVAGNSTSNQLYSKERTVEKLNSSFKENVLKQYLGSIVGTTKYRTISPKPEIKKVLKTYPAFTFTTGAVQPTVNTQGQVPQRLLQELTKPPEKLSRRETDGFLFVRPQDHIGFRLNS